MKANTDLRDEIALARHLATCAFSSTIKRGSKQPWLALLALILLVVPGTSLSSQGQTPDQAPRPARSRSDEMLDLAHGGLRFRMGGLGARVVNGAATDRKVDERLQL
jgi:hypothetical protein